MNIILTVMAENTDKQTIDKLSDNFRGYAALLRKIKQRVLIAQQRGFMQPMKKCSGCIGILVACCSKARMQTDGARKPCNGWQGI